MRYIGSKTKMLDVLKKEIISFTKCPEGSIFCDIFSGTSGVGDNMQNNYKIIANDSLYFSYIVARGKLINQEYKFENLGLDPFEYFNNIDTSNYIDGYCYKTFGPDVTGRQYFSSENARLIDFIRDHIDLWYATNKISLIEHDYLLACLIESISKVANVAGVYAAYLHIWDSRAVKKMEFIKVEHINCPKYDNIVYNKDVNELINKINGDILYLDPPYTATQYVSQYHVLETIAKNDKPITHGVGAHRDNGDQISLWCKKQFVGMELYKLISKAKFDYIIMSYSDAGIMDKQLIENIMKRHSEKGMYKFKKIEFAKYKNTRAVNKENRDNTKNKDHYEWLFMMKKTNQPKFSSPLNYIGGKFDILDFILPLFPKNIKTFYDLFGGGGTVSLNADANKIVYNDINFNVKNLLEYLSVNPIEDTYRYIEKTIKKFGLEKGNKDAYIEFRTLYNSKDINKRNPLDLYLLICYGFEHQIRYNSKMEFNNPCGNSGFNSEMLEKLISYNFESNNRNIHFNSKDYRDYFDEIKPGDFVYCDPPYLMTCGAYNDGKRGFNGWDLEQQRNLLNFLLDLNNKEVKFALSYIMERNGHVNSELNEWIEINGFKLHKNSVVTKRNRQDRIEILITNY